MVVKVKGKELLNILEVFIRTTKVMFNFKVVGSTVKVQVLENYTACVDLDCDVVSYDAGGNEVSLWLTTTMFTFSKDYDIEINIGDATTTFSQGCNESIFKNEWEARREFPDYKDRKLTNAFTKRLKYLSHTITTCNPLAKELNIAPPDPMFSNGKIYLDYGQSFLIESINYPEFCITASDMKDVVYKLEEDALMSYLEDYDVILFISGKYEFWLPVNNYNLNGSTISHMNKLLDSCQFVTTLTIKDYKEPIQVLAQAYQKRMVELCVGDNTFRVSATSPENRTVIGNNIGRGLVSMSITAMQLAVISKLFGEDEEIEVRRGVNCLILRKQEKNLLLAGLLY